jgi:hypothetical protein
LLSLHRRSVAEVHGVADDLLLVVVIGNGIEDSRWPIVIAGVLDLLERAFLAAAVPAKARSSQSP